MYLATTNTLRAKAGTATAITYTIFGDEITTGDAYSPIAQGQIAATTTTIYTAPAATQTIITEIQLANTTASPVTGITFYLNGTASTNQLNGGFSIPANGSAVYRKDNGITIYDSNGASVAQVIILTGDVTGIGSGTIATTLATVNASPGTSGSATQSSIVTTNGKGLVTANSNVTVTPAVGSITGLGTGVGTFLATPSSANLVTAVTDETGSGALVFGTAPALSAPTGLVKGDVGLGSVDNTADVAKNVLSATKWSTARTLAITGDLAYTSPSLDGTGNVTAAGILATVNTVTPGTFGSATATPVITVNGKGLTTASANVAIQSASTSQLGFQSAAQFNTVNNLWFDVTNYGVSIGNSGAVNTAAMNTLVSTTAGAGATFFFPQTGANYPFNGAILVTKNDQKFRGQGQYSSVLFQNSTTDDLFRVSDSVQNVTFEDLGLWSAVTMSAGSAINTGTVSGAGVAQLYVRNVGFQGFGGTWFNCITLNGNTGGEVALVSYCQINSFTNYGIAQVGNTTTPSTVSSMVLENTTMNGQITGTTGAVAGIYVQQSGALNIDNSDVISCTNNVLFAPITTTTQIVASVYMINSFLDHSHGSCLKLGGTEPIVRIKLTASSFTVSNDAGGNYSAIEFSNTATNPPGDIDILSCNIQNTFNATTTTNGILLTNAANVKIIGNNINGFTNNLQASAAAGAATKLNIVANSFGPGTVTSPTSTNDILLNAGTYGYIQITTNVFAPTSPFQTTSTNHITDNSTVANSALKRFGDNIGIANTGYQASIPTATQSFTVSVDNVITGTLIPLPTNGLLVGQKFRGDFRFDKTAAGAAVWSLKVKFGTNGTAADAAIATWTSGTNTALLDTAYMTIFLEVTAVGATATVKGHCIYLQKIGAAATGLSIMTVGTTSTATFNLSGSASPFIHVDCTPGAAAVMTGYGTFGQIA